MIGLVPALTTESNATYYGDSGVADAFWLIMTALLCAGLIAWALGFRNDE